MKRQEKMILDYAIEHWHREFTGISGISISRQLNIPHSEVLRVFNNLESQGYGKQRDGVKLYPLEFNPDSKEFGDTREILTSIFFPARKILEEYINNHMRSIEIPEYKLRLHKGDSQIKFYYFNQEVLQKYINHPEVYEVANSVIGGNIHQRYDYLKTLDEEEINRVMFPGIRFGKRKLEDGSVAITVIVHDLSELPKQEQKYWNSFEIENPEFCEDDPDFERFFRRDFGGEFIDDEDPLSYLLDAIAKINELFDPENLFTVIENPYLGYPTINTEKSISDCCSELWKIIGSDSLNGNLLEKILKEKFGFQEEDFYHKDSKRKKSKLILLSNICQFLDLNDLIQAINDIKDFRISADHKIIIPEFGEINYFEIYRGLVKNIMDNLVKLRIKIEELNLND